MVLSDITVEHCTFNKIMSVIFLSNNHSQPRPVTAIIKNTTFNTSEVSGYLMSFVATKLILIGPVKFHRITSRFGWLYTASIIKMQNCTFSVYGHVEFRYNKLTGLINFQCTTEDCFTMNIADNASLTIADNKLVTYFYA